MGWPRWGCWGECEVPEHDDTPLFGWAGVGHLVRGVPRVVYPNLVPAPEGDDPVMGYHDGPPSHQQEVAQVVGGERQLIPVL